MSDTTKDFLSYIASEAITAVIDAVSALAAGGMVLIVAAALRGMI
jgi:hypothetical protein